MKQINNYILEKLKITKNIKSNINNNFDFDYDDVFDLLINPMSIPYEYNGYDEYGMNLVGNSRFNKNINDFLDYFDLHDKLAAILSHALKTKIDSNDLYSFIEKNNDLLYKELNDFVLL